MRISAKVFGIQVVVLTVFLLSIACGAEAKDSKFVKAIRPLIEQKDYAGAYLKLEKLGKTTKPDAELYYLLAYTHAKSVVRSNLNDVVIAGKGVVVDSLYLELLRRSVEADPVFEAGKLSGLDGSFLFLGAQAKLTSACGQYAAQYYLLNQPREANQMYKYGKEIGGFSDFYLEYNANVLNSCEENAILFTNGDADTFPAWYLQSVAQSDWPPVIPPGSDVMQTPESQAVIKDALNRKNIELNGIRQDVTLVNLSLLNSPWYIRHLRDREGVQISWPDALLDRLAYIPPSDTADSCQTLESLFTGITREKDGYLMQVNSSVEGQNFSLALPDYPQWRNDDLCRVADLAALKIIQDNFGRRPIYFATTCIGIEVEEPWLSTEGMVKRLVSTQREDQIDITRLQDNLEHVYSYRSITARNVHIDADMRRLMMNYGAAYDLASYYYLAQKDLPQARLYLEKAFPFISKEAAKNLRLVNLLLKESNLTEATALTRKMIANKQLEANYFLYLGKIWFSYNRELTYQILTTATKRYPGNTDLAWLVYDVGTDSHTYGRALKLLKKMNTHVRRAMSEPMETLESKIQKS